MRALITGGTGFIGNRLVLRLLREGWEIVCLVRRNLEPARGHISCVAANLDQLPESRLGERVPGPFDAVFHIGAALPGPNVPVASYLISNAVATAALLEAAETWRTGAFVYTSTLLVIGKPRETPISRTHPAAPAHPYALGKLAGEQTCEFFRSTGRVPTASLRLTSVFGVGMPAASVLPKFSAAAIRSEDLFYDGEGQRVQNFVHVDDVVQACVRAARHPGAGVLNVGGKESLAMKELAEMVVRLAGESRSTVKASGRMDPQADYRWVPDIDETAAAIGYVPEARLESAIPAYIESLRQPRPCERWWNERC